MVDTVSDLQFPVWGLLPKQETGIVAFLNKYPEYDGRNIRIAIFDSGVDPGAPGLQHTSTGATKIIERYDCSGCGDVNTTTTVKQDEEGFIKGLTGRRLKIPKTWKNINEEYRIGVKNAFELYPPKLKERIENERKEKVWDAQHKVVIADATRELQKFDVASTKKNNTTLSESETLIKEDFECKVEYLTNLDKKYSDLGPIYDCVLFNDGEMWRACIDTSEEGDLENGVLLGEYSKTHQYAPLTKTDQLNISINVHDDGNVLEIVGLCSGHGTHVASIASAYFPDHPEKNGAAPGAQIISLTIGDGRLGSMETGTALVRAMIKIMELHKTNPIHVINMSYGEHANWSNSGRIGELMNEVVNKYGVVWVASAGNHGPALCTVGTPPDISQTTLIGVGAYVSPEMMVAEYSLRQKMPGMAYTWTSRGPTIDGGLGISVCAPGAAITSVPNFTLRNAQLLNGTSMSAPHVAGAVCLLLSGLVAKKLSYSPFNIKRALENTAQYLEKVESFAQGRGLLQVEKAFEHLVNYHGCVANQVRFAVSCGAHNSKGIHIRNGVLTQPLEFNVNIDPSFKDDDKITPEQKINFSMQFVFICKAPYVQYPKFLDLQNFGRTISVKVDPTNLFVGVHYTCIDAYDVACVDKGPLFTIPITIVQPQLLDCNKALDLRYNITFQPNSIQRSFFQVPETATWAVLRMRSKEEGKQGRFVIHCMQIRPKQSCKAQEFQKMTQVTSQSDTFLGFQVVGGLILEVVIAKYWANLGDIEIDYWLMFHGIKPETTNLTMQAADGLQQIDLRCLGLEEISPVVTLKSSVQVLKPTDAKISPLTKRDIIPIGRQIYELVLTYEFHISKSTEVVPNCPLLSEVLYESELESQLWMLFDNNKQLLSSGDSNACKYVVKLERGDFVIKLHVRHDKKELLEKLNDIPMLLNRKLSNSFTLDVYGSYMQAITQGKKMVSAVGSKGAIIPIYISPFLSDKSKIASVTGQYFVGTITYAKDEFGKKVDTYPFKYIPVEPTKKAASKTDKDKSKTEEYNEAIRDLKTSYLGKLDIPDLANLIYEELKSTSPDHVLIHTAMMQYLDALEVKKQLPVFGTITSDEQTITTLNKVVEIADVIINSVDIDKLLAVLAVKNDPRPDAAKIKSLAERQKTALLDALSRKGIVLCRMYLMDKNTSTNEETLESVKTIWKDVLKLVDPNEVKNSSTSIIFFALWHATVHKHYGRVLKFLLKLFEEKPQREIEEKISEVCGILGWEHCVRHINKSIPIKYPTHYRPF